jgi:predicted house-cleaning noncanonical NTP pyrophosphatase (MazG superfamily)
MKRRTFELNKLVRDKIVDSTLESGGTAQYRALKDDDRMRALYDKLDEEMAELKEGEETELEKLADVREVIEAIAVGLGHSITELHAVQYDKRRKVGGFTAGIFVETVTVPSDSEIANYYASHPDRFPEVK